MYWLIEPHADDVFLSLHQHIVDLWKDVSKTIVTVFATQQRVKEAREYALAVKCRHFCLGLEEGGGLSQKAGFVPPFDEWKLPRKRGDVLIFPIGIQHPDHLAVAKRVPTIGVVWRYLDTPYYTKQKVAQELIEKTRGRCIRSIRYATRHKWKHVEKFKSQGKFFFYNPPNTLPRMEVVMS